MTWNQLIRAVAERSGLSQTATRQVLEALVDIVREQLAAGGRVKIRGLGTFDRRWSPGRVVRSIASGRRTWVGGRHRPEFRPARSLRSIFESDSEAWRGEEVQRAWRLAETLIDDLDLYHSDLAPSLASAADVDAAERMCAEAFGTRWAQVRKTWESKVPGDVKDPFLGIAARRRWG